MAKVITEKLEGIHSFRGVGFVKVDEMQLPVCGSMKLNCGKGLVVSYIQESIKRKPEEPEFRASIAVTVTEDEFLTDDGTPVIFNKDGIGIMYLGDVDGVFGGCLQYGGARISPVHPFRLQFVPISSPQPDQLNTAFNIGSDEHYFVGAGLVKRAILTLLA